MSCGKRFWAHIAAVDVPRSLRQQTQATSRRRRRKESEMRREREREMETDFCSLSLSLSSSLPLPLPLSFSLPHCHPSLSFSLLLTPGRGLCVRESAFFSSSSFAHVPHQWLSPLSHSLSLSYSLTLSLFLTHTHAHTHALIISLPPPMRSICAASEGPDASIVLGFFFLPSSLPSFSLLPQKSATSLDVRHLSLSQSSHLKVRAGNGTCFRQRKAPCSQPFIAVPLSLLLLHLFVALLSLSPSLCSALCVKMCDATHIPFLSPLQRSV